MSCPYIICVGDARDSLDPYMSAPNKQSAINKAVLLQDNFKCIEVIYMPEDNDDVNEVVYTYNNI